MDIKIKGLVKTSLVDYPGKIVSVVFLAGCNFRCPFCFNVDIVNDLPHLRTIPPEEIIALLESHKKILDGLCITGGEPTLHAGLANFMKTVKERGFLVKLDTNGSTPHVLEGILEEKLADYIAMDVKAPIEKYRTATNSNIDAEHIEKSIGLIMNSGTDYEFRTTVVPELHTKEDIVEIARRIQGAKQYFLQQFRPGRTLDERFGHVKPFSERELEAMKNACSEFVPTAVKI